MSSIFVKQTAPPSPPLEGLPGTVEFRALSAGHLTLPENKFVHLASDEARSTVPSYSEPIQRHAATRQPISTDPDVVKSLKAGGFTPNDIDFVIYSHVHWDHVGEPRDFPRSTFVVGCGAGDLLYGTSASFSGGHSFFESDLIPQDRTIEISSPTTQITADNNMLSSQKPGIADFHQQWLSHLHFPHVIDLFQDGSLYMVDSPGHLLGRINILARTGTDESVLLAGDACHDRRILRKEKAIGTWPDAEGYTCCIHANREQAEESIDRIRELERQGIEVIFAHDVEWEQDSENRRRFLGS